MKEDKKYTCAVCNTVNSKAVDPDKGYMVFYNAIMMHCKWKSLGCHASVNITDDEQHANLCEYNGFKTKTCSKCNYTGPFLVDGQVHDCLAYLKRKTTHLQEDLDREKEIVAKLEKELECVPALIGKAVKETEVFKDKEISRLQKEGNEYFEKMTRYQLEEEAGLIIRPAHDEIDFITKYIQEKRMKVDKSREVLPDSSTRSQDSKSSASSGDTAVVGMTVSETQDDCQFGRRAGSGDGLWVV